MIKFDFNLIKAVRTMGYITHKIPGVEKVKITKLVFLADKEHFLRHGYPITGDMQYAMPWGPVPTDCLHALDGELADPASVFDFLHVDDNRILLKSDPGITQLGATEVDILDEVVGKHGGKYWKKLVDELHELPEFKEVYIPKTSRLIPYEVILKHSGDARHFRLNRPVISREMRQHMSCPFPA